MPVELPRWSMGLHKTQGEIAEIKELVEQGELPRDTLKRLEDAEDEAVHGVDAKKDRKGKRIQQGIGAPGHESGNHFASILRYEGKDAYEAAVREIWKRDPDRAGKLNLPKIKEKIA